MQKIIQNSFLGGQLDFEMMGRQDFAKYRKGASKLVNFNLLKRGGITKRQGFDHILTISDSTQLGGLGIPNDSKVRLVPFAYKKDHGMVLLFAGKIGNFNGGCWVIYTMKGVIHSTWSVPCPASVGAFLNSDIGEFDYAQCGYKLFIAHQGHPPSVIWTNETLVNNAVANPSAPSPLTWELFDISGTANGVPSITMAEQSRVCPTKESEGATYTEKYKASAIFDDSETKPCTEFYNESCIEPVAMNASGSGETLIGVSKSTTAGYTTRTDPIGTSTAQSSSTSIPDVTNTGKTYTAKKKGTCNGTKYYLPWTESQTIKLTVSPATRNGVYPDKIAIYKRASSYYGLIGTINLFDEGNTSDVGIVAGSIYGTKINAETIGTKTDRVYETETALSTISFGSTDARGANRTGHVIAYGSGTSQPYLYIIPLRTIFGDSTVRLFLGKANIEFTQWSGQSTYGYQKPTDATFHYVNNVCESISVKVKCKYTNGNGERVTTEFTTPPIGPLHHTSVSDGSYHESATIFKKNYISQFNSWKTSRISGTTTFDFKISDLEGYPETAEGTKVTIDEIDIMVVSRNGNLVVNGIAVKGPAVGTLTFTDNNIIPDNSITPVSEDYEPPFQGGGNYPASVAVYQQRLVWASSKNKPETVWMSAVGDFYDYTEHEIQNDDDAIEFSMPVTRFAKINHIVEMKRLIAFNSACEWIVDSSSSQKGITYETIRAMPQSYSGSNARMKPLICNNSLVFVERTGQAVRRFAYNIQDDGFAGRDVSILAASIFEHNSIVDWTYQQHPFSTVWCVLNDGTLASLSLMEEQEIIAWATHKHGDPSARITNVATSYAVGPSLADIESSLDEPFNLATTEEVFAIVERRNSSGSVTSRSIERMRVRSEAKDSIYNSVCMDSVKVNASTSVYLLPNQVGINPTDGTVTRYDATATGSNANVVPPGTIVGYPFESKFTSVYPTLGEQYVGLGQFGIKNLTNLHLRLEASYGGKVAATRIENQALPIRYDDDKGNDMSATFANGVATFRNCDAANSRPVGCNNRDGRISVIHNDPWPFTLISYEAEYATEGERYVQ